MITRFVEVTSSLLLLAFLTSTASAEIQHVSAGADPASADGTAAHPWSTLTQAASKLVTGDTLVVGPGTYPEKVVFTTSGVTIEAAPGPMPVIDGGGTLPGSYTGLVELAGNDIVFSGLQVQNSSAMGILSSGNNNTVKDCLTQGHHYYGIRYANVSGGLVQNNEVTNNVQGNKDLHGLGAGCLLIQESTNIKVLDNHIYENYGFGTSLVEGQGHVYAGNRVYDNVNFGVAAIATKDVTINGNFFYQTDKPAFHEAGTPMLGINLEITEVTNPAVQTNIVTNNIIINCQIGIIWAKPTAAAGMNGTLIANNTIIKTHEATFYFDEMSTQHNNSTIANNIIRSPNEAQFFVTDGLTFQSNNWDSHPAPAGATSPSDPYGRCKVVDLSTYTAESFKLAPIPGGTPCQNAGTALPAVTVDYFGTARPIEGTYDVGAHEAEPAPPLPPDQGVLDSGPSDAAVPDAATDGAPPGPDNGPDRPPDGAQRDTSSESDGGNNEDDGGGCGCHLSSAADGSIVALLLVVLLWRSRRRNHRSA